MKLPTELYILGFLLGLAIIAALTIVFGGGPIFNYVESEDYNGVIIKFYSDGINETEAYKQMDLINESYFEGVQYIRYHEETSRSALGLYWWWSRGIDIYECNPNCNPAILIHELAHHCQYRRGDFWIHGLKHSGHFQECLEEIGK